MARGLEQFERIVRKAFGFTDSSPTERLGQHPFEQRDVHEALPSEVRSLFDNGHYAQATFEAFKYVDNLVRHLAGGTGTGFKLMMQAFAQESPQIALTPNKTESEQNEQRGYQFIFAGSVLAIRNPRGHEYGLQDSPDACLDHLAFASLLLRRLEQANLSVYLS